jgi:hypothetical protein
MKNIWVFGMLFLCAYALTAQDASWVNYTQPYRSGGMLETTNTIWLGTDGGLLEIDKNSWASNYWTKANAGLSSNMIEDVAIHPLSQDIYIGTYDVALMVREADGDSWETLPYPASITDETGLMIQTYCLEFDGQGVLWAGTDKGLIRYDGENWSLIDSSSDNLMGPVWDVQFDENGKLYISSHGLFELEGEELTLLTPEGDVDGDFLFGYAFSKLFRSEDGQMWFFTDLGTVGYYDGSTWSIDALPNPGFIGMGHFSVGYNAEGMLEVLVSGKDPYIFTESGWQQQPNWYTASTLIRQYFLDDGTRFGVTEKAYIREDGEAYHFTNYPFRHIPSQLRNDQEGRLWMVDSANILLNPATGETFVPEGQQAPLAGFHDYIFATDGSFWCLSAGTVYRYHNGQWTKYDHTNTILPDTYGYSSIQSMNNDEAWLYIYDYGIYRFRNDSWEKQTHPAFTVNNLLDMQAVPEGLWIKMITPGFETMLAFWDGVELDIIEDQENGYTNGSIASFTYDAANERLWLLGYEQVQYYEHGSWYPFELPDYIFEEGYLEDIIVQGDQLIFYGYFRMYIYRDGEWQTINAANSPLSNKKISEIGLDEHGYLWVTRGNAKVVDRYELGLVSADVEELVQQQTNLLVLENPVREGLLKIFSPALEDKNPHLLLVDAAGRKYPVNSVGNMMLNSAQYGNAWATIDVSHLPSGWYVISLITEKGTQSQAFVK